MLDCLQIGNLLREVNSTILNMVPKVACPNLDLLHVVIIV